MKRRSTFATLAFIVTTMFATNVGAQHGYRLEKQINFAAGQSSAVVKGRIADEQETHEYKFKAREGQRVEVRVASRNTDMSFILTDAGDERIGDAALKTHNWEGELASTGEYRILVHALSGKGRYTLFVTIK